MAGMKSNLCTKITHAMGLFIFIAQTIYDLKFHLFYCIFFYSLGGDVISDSNHSQMQPTQTAALIKNPSPGESDDVIKY